jgi:hypothetical protein
MTVLLPAAEAREGTCGRPRLRVRRAAVDTATALLVLVVDDDRTSRGDHEG